MDRIIYLLQKTPFYYIYLGKPKFAKIHNFICCKRKGDSEKGLKIILNKQFEYGGQDITVGSFDKMFKKSKNLNNLWAFQVNSFAWLRDLNEVNSNSARVCARNLIRSWMSENSRWSEENWNMGIIGKRLFFMLSCYDFYGSSADNEFKEKVMLSMYKQEKHMLYNIKKEKNIGTYDYLQAVKGLLFANIFFPGQKKYLDYNLLLFKKSLDKQMLSDGCHISRNSFISFKILRSLLDIDYILRNSHNDVPDFLNIYIRNITKFIKSISYKDGKLPLFNGSFEYSEAKISDVMNKLSFRVKTENSFPISGYERISEGKTNILISTATDSSENRHYGVGSFEMQHDKKRILVNCGAFVYKEKWRQALQNTNAHSVMTVENDNNIASKSKVTRRNNKNSTSIVIENDGYEKSKISRKILVSDDGRSIMGSDMLESSSKKDIVIRFHLHPDVSASLIKNGKSVLLKVGKSSGWMFKSSNMELSLEEGVYFGRGSVPQQTKQIILKKKITKEDNVVSWVLEKI